MDIGHMEIARRELIKLLKHWYKVDPELVREAFALARQLEEGECAWTSQLMNS